MKKRFRFIFFALLIMLVFTSCAKEEQGGGEVDIDAIPRLGGVINLQMRYPDTFDPLTTESQTTRDALLIVYEPLFDVTDSFEPEGVLAESFKFSSDARVLTVKLKEGVLWHNGERFNADDVIYTVEKIMENESSSYHENLKMLDSVSRVNDYEVIFRLKEPYAQFIYALYFPIINKGIDVDNAIVGTGPYMLDNVDTRQMELKRFQGWHGGSSYADGVYISFMRTSLMAQDAFSSGKIHAVSEDMLDSENFAIKEGMKSAGCPGGVFEFVGFNTENGLFSDPLLRIAVANAIDRTKIDECYGASFAAGFPINTGSFEFSPSYETGSFNAEYAREVIFSAGWVDTNYDDKPEKVVNNVSRPLSFTLLVSDSDSARRRAAYELEKELEGVGFSVTVSVLSHDDYLRHIKDGNFDAFLGAVYLDVPYDISPLFASDGRLNFCKYSSPSMDQALKALSSSGNGEGRITAFSAVQSVFIAEQPLTGLAFRAQELIVSDALGGDIRPYPYSPYANIDKWFIK